MHDTVRPRKTEAIPSSHPPQATEPLALLFVAVANVALAFGPWFVRVADTGPVASAFWRITLAAPLMLVMSFAIGARSQRLRQWLWVSSRCRLAIRSRL